MINLADYAAAGDPDQSAQIQAAFTAAGWKRLYIPEGEYFGQNITIPNGVQVEGDGMGVSKLTLKAGGSGPGANLFFGGAQTGGFSFSKLTLNGNRPNNANNISGHWMVLQTCYDFEIIRCEMRDAMGGFIAQIGCSDGTLAFNRVRRSSSHAFSLSESSRINVDSNKFFDIRDAAVNLAACIRCPVKGNVAENPTMYTDGYGAYRLTNGSMHNPIIGNTAVRWCRGIFLLTGSKYNPVVGNTLQLIGDQGILDQAGCNLIEANIVLDSGELQNLGSTSGLHLDSADFTMAGYNLLRDDRTTPRMEHGVAFSGTTYGVIASPNSSVGTIAS